jgi:RNA polymerase sigma factor (sigma-70 family)
MNYNEIESCVIRAKKGYQEDMLEILNQFRPFIIKTARQFNIRNFDLYDLIQIANIALINAVARYNLGSHSFVGYALSAIRNELRYTARKNSKFMGNLSLNSHMEFRDNSSDEIMDCIAADVNLEEDMLRSESFSEVRQAISKLAEDELELVEAVYYGGASLKAYAEKKGLVYSQAVTKKNRILKKLNHLVR